MHQWRQTLQLVVHHGRAVPSIAPPFQHWNGATLLTNQSAAIKRGSCPPSRPWPVARAPRPVWHRLPARHVAHLRSATCKLLSHSLTSYGQGYRVVRSKVQGKGTGQGYGQGYRARTKCSLKSSSRSNLQSSSQSEARCKSSPRIRVHDDSHTRRHPSTTAAARSNQESPSARRNSRSTTTTARLARRQDARACSWDVSVAGTWRRAVPCRAHRGEGGG